MDTELSKNELVSALFDGECTAGEIDSLLDEMERSPELKAQWGRLSQVRAAQDNIPIGRLDNDFSARVMASLVGVGFDDVDEPAPLAQPAIAAKIVQFPQRAQQPRKSRQPMFALAAAASLAVVAVVTHFEKPDDVVPGSSNALANAAGSDIRVGSSATGEASGLVATAYRPVASTGSLMAMRLSNRDEESGINQSFDDYIVAHEGSQMRFNNHSNLRLVDYQLSAQR